MWRPLDLRRLCMASVENLCKGDLYEGLWGIGPWGHGIPPLPSICFQETRYQAIPVSLLQSTRRERYLHYNCPVNSEVLTQYIYSLCNACCPFGRFFATMPAYSEKDDTMATKILSFYPENINAPRHTSHVLLFDPKNGTLLAVGGLLSLCIYSHTPLL